MIRVNESFLKLNDNYLFFIVTNKTAEFQKLNPDKKIIKLGIGDVTLPVPNAALKAMHLALDEMSKKETFRGYGPEEGYNFLKETIIKNDYLKRKIELEKSEVFISDGIATDIGNIVDIFDIQNSIAIIDPVYPAYLDTNVMSGRTGHYDDKTGKYRKVEYIHINEENNFIPDLPKHKVSMIYLCFPNNPTGTVIDRSNLTKWVNYAKRNKAILLYDAAYEGYISDDNIAHSIYEIEGAKEVAIEFKSYSKTAGFTGLRCGYTIIPKELYGYTNGGKKVQLNKLWRRRQCTKFNGVSYITQKGAEAIYTEEGQKEVNANIAYYMENAKIIKQGLEEAGFKVYGGENAPYIWLKTPNNMKSWDFFDELLEKANVVGTPGVGFGPSGEGYFRLTAFNTRENTEEAIKRIKDSLSFFKKNCTNNIL